MVLGKTAFQQDTVGLQGGRQALSGGWRALWLGGAINFQREGAESSAIVESKELIGDDTFSAEGDGQGRVPNGQDVMCRDVPDTSMVCRNVDRPGDTGSQVGMPPVTIWTYGWFIHAQRPKMGLTRLREIIDIAIEVGLGGLTLLGWQTEVAPRAQLLQLPEARILAAMRVPREFMEILRVLRSVAFKKFQPTQLAIRGNDAAQRRDVMECGTAKAVSLRHASMIAPITMHENAFGNLELIILRKFNNLCVCMSADLMECLPMCGQRRQTRTDPDLYSQSEYEVPLDL